MINNNRENPSSSVQIDDSDVTSDRGVVSDTAIMFISHLEEDGRRWQLQICSL